MRIFDISDNEITAPDLLKGYLREDRRFVTRHEAVEAVQEQGHYETVREYLNGGKDVAWVIDVPGVQAQGAWDEYEDIRRYIEYTPEELAAMEAERNRPTQEERIAELEAAFELLLSGGTE